MSAAAGRSALGGAGAGAWRRAAFALFAVAAGTNVSTPLLLLYRHELQLSKPATTLVFGVYAAGLAPSLLSSGPISDRFGRRRVVVPFTALAGLASLLFVAATDSFALLLVARFVQGLVSGAVFTAASAWLAELCGLVGEREAAGRRATVCLAGGFSLGPLVAAVVAQLLPHPLVLPYVLHAVLVAVGLVVLLGVPETAGVRAPSATPVDAGGPLVPRGQRVLALTALAPVAVCVYAFPATAIAGLPQLVRLPGDGVLTTGILAGLTLGTGAVVAPLQSRLGSRTALAAATSGTLGFLGTVAAAASGSWGWLVPSALLLGAGSGWALASGLALVLRLAPVARRGALTGIFYTIAYVGFASPYVITAAAGTGSGVTPLLVAAVLAGALAVRLVRPATAGRL